MPLFKVRVPKFKVTAFQQGSEPLPEAVPASALAPVWSEGVRKTTETLVIDGVPKQVTREQRASRRLQGRQVLREWVVIEANSPEEAQGKFGKLAGFARDRKTGIVKQPGNGYEVEPYEAAAESGPAVATLEAPAGKRPKRSAEEALRQSFGGKSLE